MSTRNLSTAVRLLQVNRLVLHHSALLERLPLLLNEALNDELADSPQRRFLQGVIQYDQMTRGELPKDWDALHQYFEQVRAASASVQDSVLHCLLLNYSFLTLRNADTDGTKTHRLKELSDEALKILDRLHLPWRHLLEGFVTFNIARWEHGLGNMDESLGLLKRAAANRAAWYKDAWYAREESTIITAAAEQVRKLRGAFGKMFPNRDFADLQLSDGLMDEVTAIAPGDREVK